MNQPQEPQSPHGNAYGDYGQPGGYGAHGQQPYGQSGQPPQQQAYGAAGAYGAPGAYGGPAAYEPPGGQGGFGSDPGQPQPPRSKVPMLVAAGLVVALAIGVTLFLVLRDDPKTPGGGGTAAPSAAEITGQFFQAVDDVDENDMKKVARGDMLDDIQEIIDEGGTEQVKFTDGESIADAAKQVDDVEIAVVVWELTDVPVGESDTIQLEVGLLDDGDGFKVCHIKDSDALIDAGDDEAAGGLVDDWAAEYAEHCAYQK